MRPQLHTPQRHLNWKHVKHIPRSRRGREVSHLIVPASHIPTAVMTTGTKPSMTSMRSSYPEIRCRPSSEQDRYARRLRLRDARAGPTVAGALMAGRFGVGAFSSTCKTVCAVRMQKRNVSRRQIEIMMQYDSWVDWRLGMHGVKEGGKAK